MGEFAEPVYHFPADGNERPGMTARKKGLRCEYIRAMGSTVLTTLKSAILRKQKSKNPLSIKRNGAWFADVCVPQVWLKLSFAQVEISGAPAWDSPK